MSQRSWWLSIIILISRVANSHQLEMSWK